MNTKQAIKQSITGSQSVCNAYLEDLADEELLVRPVEGANHIAWQLGHLISSEHHLTEQVAPGSMPALPDGFAEKHTNETAGLDDASAFHTKDEYLKLAEQQRSGTLSALESISDDDLDKPAPEELQSLCKTVGDVFILQGTHWLMHGGQWAIVRRKLGRPPIM